MMRPIYLAVLCATLLLPQALWAAVKVQRIDVSEVGGLVAQDTSVPAFDLTLVVRGAGSAADVQGKEGLAQVAAAMLTEGAGGYDDEAFHQLLEAHAIDLSVSASEDALSLHIKSLSEQAPKAFELLALVLQQPRLSEESLAQVKERMQVRLRRLKESPGAQAQLAWNALAFGAHPYGRPSSGSAESVASITTEDVHRWLEGHLGRDQMLFAVAGDVSISEVKERLAQLLDPLPSAAQGAAEAPSVDIASAGKEAQVKMDVPQSVVVFGHQGIARSNPDFYAVYLLNQVVGGMSLTSRLGHEMREKRGLTYGVDTSLQALQGANIWSGSFATRADQLPEAMQVMEDTLRALAQNGISADELEQARRYVLGSFPLGLDSNGAIAAYLVGMQLYGLGDDYLEKRNQYFAAVTLEDVNRLAAQLLDPDRLIVVRTGPESSSPEAKTTSKE